jgi:predicted MFS family arabinose efflux permease
VTELVDWRVLFALNAPVGIALWLALRGPDPARRSQRQLPDGLGVALVTVSVALLTIGTTKGSVLALLAGGAGLVLAVARSARSRSPAIDVALLRHPDLALANAISLVFSLAVFAWLLAGPLFAAQVWGYGALTAALSVAPCAVSAALASLVVGRMSATSRRRWTLAGTLLFAAVAGGLAVRLGDDPSFLGVWLPAGLLSGAAIGSVLASLSATVADSLPADSFAAGAGLNMTARQLGASLGVALLAGLLGSPGSAGDFTAVWLAGGAASLIAAAGGMALLARPPGSKRAHLGTI